MSAGARIRRQVASPIAALLLAGGGISAAAVAWWAAPASASTIHVSTEGAFRAAFNSNTDDTIVLDADIHLTSAAPGCARATRTTANNPLTVDGQGQFKIVQDCTGFGVLSVVGPFPTANTTNLTLRGLTITGGNDASDGGGLEFEGGTLVIDHTAFLNNAATSTFADGGGVDFEGHSSLTVSDSTFSGNSAADDGGGLNCDSGGATTSRTITITRTTFVGNSTVAGLGNSGGAIDMENSDPCALTMTNSTVTQNTSGDDAAVTGELSSDTITLVYSSIVNNATSPATPGPAAANPGAKSPDTTGHDSHTDGSVQPANNNTAVATANVEIENPANLSVFGTVIARPHGGPNCSTLAGAPLTGVASSGYNFADDTSCALAAATDKQGAGLDPLLGPPANNGGPTLTLLPQLTSPLVDAIPAAACQTAPAAGVTTDQRGIARPQGLGCDIGAVELEVVQAVPRFTG